MILNILIAIAAFGFMEFIAWSNHKFVMHGFLWKWHADHHVNDHKKNASQTDLYQTKFEKNDYFFLVYAIPAIAFLIGGLYYDYVWMTSIGIGMSAYGVTYFLLHDVMVHQRLRIPFLINPKSKYLQSVIEAHLAHHRGKDVCDFKNYGLLIFQKRFLKK